MYFELAGRVLLARSGEAARRAGGGQACGRRPGAREAARAGEARGAKIREMQ